MATLVRKKHSVDTAKDNDAGGTGIGGPPRTKRRRSAAVPVKAEPPDVWILEEAEAEERNPEKDQQLFRQACGNVRRIMKEIMELKKQKNSAAEIAEKRVQASLLFLTMKKLNRLEKIRNRKVRDATNEAKQKVDTHHLQLQNLLYEVSHLTKEINKCLDFKSTDEEIELVSIEEFYREAPPEISKPERTLTNTHEQTLARLNWELEQRKRLALKCSEAEKQKEDILKEIRSKKESLDTLAPCLAAILQATLPVQEQLGVVREAKHRQNKVAAYLPTPLFILHAQMSAYAYAWGKQMDVTVGGDIEEVKALKDLTEERDDDSADSDQEESAGEKRYRRKTTDKVTEARRKILRKHPLYVSVTFTAKDGSKLKLCFYYLISLHVVTVTIDLSLASDLRIPSRNVLCNSILLDVLFPNDNGSDTPNKANYYQLKRLGMDDFHVYVGELGRPYLWAQRLAGLYFVQELNTKSTAQIANTAITPKAETSCSHMEAIALAIEQRLNNRISLQKQLIDLEQGIIPVPAELMKLFPAKIVTRLTSWSSLDWNDYRASSQTNRFVDGGMVTDGDFFFSVTFERGQAKLLALVAISQHYPKEPPIFALDVAWKRDKLSRLQDSISAIQDMEMEVNLHWDELVETSDLNNSASESRPPAMLSQLLTAQVQRLAVCFDVYLETTVTETPDEFVGDKVFFGATKRGRSRRKPFKYIPQARLFTHR